MAEPLAGLDVLRNRMKAALIKLKDAERGILDAVIELRSQEYVTEANDLQLVLDDLIAEYDAIVTAITA